MLLAAPAAAQQPEWERLLPVFGGAMRACLEDLPNAMVLEAWPLAGARLEMLIRHADGSAEVCVVDSLSGRGVLQRRPPSLEEARGPHPRAFMLERRCADAERVSNPGGVEFGWLAYPGCG